MKTFLTPLIVVLASASTLLSGCAGKNENDIKPAVGTPQVGSLSGQVLPIQAALSVVAVPKSGMSVSIVPSENGEFAFQDLPAGEWTLRFFPAQNYDVPPAQIVKVGAGSAVKASPTVVTTSTVASGWWVVNSKYQGICLINSSYQSNNLTFSGRTPCSCSSMEMELVGIADNPSSFVLGGAKGSSQITFSAKNMAGNTQQWTTVGGSGTVNVSMYATNPRRAFGTFTCQAVEVDNPSAAPTEITGRFNSIYY